MADTAMIPGARTVIVLSVRRMALVEALDLSSSKLMTFPRSIDEAYRFSLANQYRAG